MNRAKVTSLRAHMAEHYPEILEAISPALDTLEAWPDWKPQDMRVAISSGVAAFLLAEKKAPTSSQEMARRDVAEMYAKMR